MESLNRSSSDNEFDSAEAYEVEAILDCRIIKGAKGNIRQYYIKWAGFSIEDATWEDEANLDGY